MTVYDRTASGGTVGHPSRMPVATLTVLLTVLCVPLVLLRS